jgi:hypothetical protein
MDFFFFSCYRLQLSGGRKRQDLVRQYSVDFRKLLRRDSASVPQRTSSGRTVKRRFSQDVEDLYTVSYVALLNMTSRLLLEY